MAEKPKKALGQHWLFDHVALDAMCDAANVGANDVVLEIGPGFGTLTSHLVERAGQVVAVEFDSQLAKRLPERVDARNLAIVHADIMRYDLTKLPPGYKVVANIPYYITGKIFQLLTESKNPPSLAALLVQKEVAERVAAKPGDMSILSVTVQYYCEVHLGVVVPAELFTPPPKVHSQIITLSWRDEPLFDADPKAFFRLVKAGFAGRRKMLRGSLSGGLRLGKKEVEVLLSKAGIDGSLRAQMLSLEEWHRLYQAATGR